MSRLSDEVVIIFMAYYNLRKNKNNKTEEKSKDENASSTGLDINNGEEIRDIDLDFAARKTEYIGALIHLKTRNENERRLTEECMQLYELSNIKNTTQQKKEEILARLKQKYFELLIARKKYDSSVEIFTTCMIPHESEYLRKKYHHYGPESDPFFNAFDKIYPGEGLKGFVKENPALFKNVPEEEIEKASKEYNDYSGFCSPTVLKIFTLPVLAAMYLIQVRVVPDANPILWGPGVYLGIMSILTIPVVFVKKIYNTSIFNARNRVMKDSYLQYLHRRSSYSKGQNTGKSMIQGTETNWSEPKNKTF